MAVHHPDAPAFVRLDTGESLSFAEWEARANRLAARPVAPMCCWSRVKMTSFEYPRSDDIYTVGWIARLAERPLMLSRAGRNCNNKRISAVSVRAVAVMIDRLTRYRRRSKRVRRPGDSEVTGLSVDRYGRQQND